MSPSREAGNACRPAASQCIAWLHPPPGGAASLGVRVGPDEIARSFAACDEPSLPVLDEHGDLRGIVHRRDLADALASEMPDGSAADLAAASHTPLRPDMSLESALELLVSTGGGLPVADAGAPGILGWITDRDAPSTYTKALRSQQGPLAAGVPELG